jgi:predicted chitinase
MKIIISESQKILLIKKHLSEQSVDLPGDESFSVGGFLKKAFERAKEIRNKPSSSSTDDSSVDSSSDNVQGSGTFGEVKLLGNFDGVQKNNISLLIDEMKKKGITDPLAQIGMLSVVKKESNFKPKGEVSYANTDNSRIRKIFGSRVSKFSDGELNKLKSNAKEFFNLVYAKIAGNQGGGDGWNFRGRGFNQLTGRGNYRKYGQLSGVSLESNPEMLNRNDIAAKIAVTFLLDGQSPSSIPKFKNKEEAASYFADKNARKKRSGHRDKAIEASKSFDIA